MFVVTSLVLGCANGALPSYGLDRLVAISEVVALVSVDAASKMQGQKGRIRYQAAVLDPLKGREIGGDYLCFEASISLAVGEKALVFLRLADTGTDKREELFFEDGLCKKSFDLEAGFAVDPVGALLYGDNYLRVPATAIKLVALRVGAKLPVKEISYSTDGLLHAPDISVDDGPIVVDYLIRIEDLTSAVTELVEKERD